MTKHPLRRTLGQWATGVSVVTTVRSDGQPVGITANSFVSVSIEPPLVLWCLASGSPNAHVFCEGKAFIINVLDAAQIALAVRFAKPALNKFAGLAIRAGENGVPSIDAALAIIECRTARVIAGGDHLIVVGEVTHFGHVAEGEPLIFFGGNFMHVAELADEAS